MTATTVVGAKQGNAPCKIFLHQQLIFVLVEFHGDHKTVSMLR